MSTKLPPLRELLEDAEVVVKSGLDLDTLSPARYCIRGSEMAGSHSVSELGARKTRSLSPGVSPWRVDALTLKSVQADPLDSALANFDLLKKDIVKKKALLTECEKLLRKVRNFYDNEQRYRSCLAIVSKEEIFFAYKIPNDFTIHAQRLEGFYGFKRFYGRGRKSYLKCKELLEKSSKLQKNHKDLEKVFSRILKEAYELIEPPSFLKLSQEWTESFGLREIFPEKIMQGSCEKLIEEIVRQETYLQIEEEDSNGYEVNAISAARALMSLVERVFKESLLSYWETIKEKEEGKVLSDYVLSQNNKEEELRRAFSNDNFTIFTAQYFIQLLAELGAEEKLISHSTGLFFNEKYLGWIESAHIVQKLKELRLNLRNPIMHDKKDVVDLATYEKYLDSMLSSKRFSTWLFGSKPGKDFFKMQDSPLLEGQLISKGAY